MALSGDALLKIIALCVEQKDAPVLYATLQEMGVGKAQVKKLVRQGKIAEVYLTFSRGYRAAVATWEWVARHHPESMPKENPPCT